MPQDSTTYSPDLIITFTHVPFCVSRRYPYSTLPPFEGLSAFLLREFGLHETYHVKMYIEEIFGEGEVERVRVQGRGEWELWVAEMYERLETAGGEGDAGFVRVYCFGEV